MRERALACVQERAKSDAAGAYLFRPPSPPDPMQRLALFALVLLAAEGLAGCSASPPASVSALPGTTWLVDRIVEPDGSVRRGTGETVSFGADGRVSLTSCNVCSGSYSVTSAGMLTLAPNLACSLRACPAGVTELEREMVGPLRASRDGEYLVLAAADRQILLLPDAVPDVQPDAPVR